MARCGEVIPACQQSAITLPQPEPATVKRSDNAYIFERSVTELFADRVKQPERI
jgi:hypothetical protein